MRTPWIAEIVDRHAIEVGELVALRHAVVRSPSTTLVTIEALDVRIERHLDGVRQAGEVGWEVASRRLSADDPASVFVAAVAAIEGSDPARLDAVAGAAEATEPARDGFSRALGWAGPERAAPVVSRFARSRSPRLASVAAVGAAEHRLPEVPPLEPLFDAPIPEVRLAALRAATRLRRRELLAAAYRRYAAPGPEERFHALRAGLLLGDMNALAGLEAEALRSGPFSDEAVDLVIRASAGDRPHPWIAAARSGQAHDRTAVLATAALGDPVDAPFLLDALSDPALARSAANGLVQVTGVSLRDAGADAAEPSPAFETEPVFDLDDGLPWPEPTAYRAWWTKNGGAFRAGQRYVLGAPIGRDRWVHALGRATQRLRCGAAVELALEETWAPVFDTIRRAEYQRQELSGLARTIN